MVLYCYLVYRSSENIALPITHDPFNRRILPIFMHIVILIIVVVSFGSGSGTLCCRNKGCKYPLRQGVVIMLVRIYNTSTSTA